MNDSLRDEFFCRYGDVAVKFSNLEFATRQLIAKLLDNEHPFVGALATNEMSFSQVIRILRKLANYCFAHDASMRDRLSSLLRELDCLRKIRNDYVHSLWVMNDKYLSQSQVECVDGRIRRMTKEQPVSWGMKPPQTYTFKEIEELSDRVGKLVVKVFDLASTLGRCRPHMKLSKDNGS